MAAKATGLGQTSKCPETKPETAGMMRWLLTYADMITLLLAFFILLYADAADKMSDAAPSEAMAQAMQVAFSLAEPANSAVFGGNIIKKDVGATITPKTSLENYYEKISKFLSEDELKYVQLIANERGMLISFVSSAFFEEGSRKLLPRGRKILDKLARLLTEEITTSRVVVEGHTDIRNINKEDFPTNWELSVLRAVTVVRYLTEEKNIEPTRFSATGFSCYQPYKYRQGGGKVAVDEIRKANLTEEDRADNRRIEILIPHD